MEQFSTNIAGVMVISVLLFAYVEISKYKKDERATQERKINALARSTQLLAGALMVDSPLLIAIRDTLSAAVPITDIALWDNRHQIATFGSKVPKRGPNCTIPLPNGGEIQLWMPTNEEGELQFYSDVKSLTEQP